MSRVSKPIPPAGGGPDELERRVQELEAELAERDRAIAELRESSARAERKAGVRLAAAHEELSALRYYTAAWHHRRATKAIRLLDASKVRLAPPGSVRDQTLGYAQTTARMGVGAAVKLGRKVAGPLLPAPTTHDGSGKATAAADGHIRAEPSSCNTGEPLISVIMPVFNAQRSNENYLGDALDSIAAQTYHAFELIIVDDGSTDDTAQVVEKFIEKHPELTVAFLHKENGGQSSARNLAAQHARGDWLAFLDQDDLWMPDRLQAVIPHLVDDVDLVYTDADTIDENSQVLLTAIHVQHGAGGKQPKTSLEDGLYQDIFVMPGVTTLRKELFERIGGFDEQLSGYEDDDLILRAVQAGTIGYVPLSTLRWRMYGANYSQTRRMVDSRLIFWRKLVRDYTDGGRNRARARRITLRFFREFLTQCTLRLDEGDELASVNLEAALELLPYLGPVDRAAFALTKWAWASRSTPAFYARWWFLNGLETAAD